MLSSGVLTEPGLPAARPALEASSLRLALSAGGGTVRGATRRAEQYELGVPGQYLGIGKKAPAEALVLLLPQQGDNGALPFKHQDQALRLRLPPAAALLRA